MAAAFLCYGSVMGNLSVLMDWMNGIIYVVSQFVDHLKIGLFFQTYNSPEEKARCTNDHYRCDIDGTCIPSSWLCDDQNDCEDGSDEIGCSKNGPTFKRIFNIELLQPLPANSMNSNVGVDRNVCSTGKT